HHLRTYPQHAAVAAQKNDINGVSHADGMHRLARHDQQCRPEGWRFAPKQAAQARNEPAREPPSYWHRRCRLLLAVVANDIHAASSISFIAIGNARIMKVQGKMKTMRGNSIFTGACKASLSACRKRSARR